MISLLMVWLKHVDLAQSLREKPPFKMWLVKVLLFWSLYWFAPKQWTETLGFLNLKHAVSLDKTRCTVIYGRIEDQDSCQL